MTVVAGVLGASEQDLEEIALANEIFSDIERNDSCSDAIFELLRLDSRFADEFIERQRTNETVEEAAVPVYMKMAYQYFASGEARCECFLGNIAAATYFSIVDISQKGERHNFENDSLESVAKHLEGFVPEDHVVGQVTSGGTQFIMDNVQQCQSSKYFLFMRGFTNGYDKGHIAEMIIAERARNLKEKMSDNIYEVLADVFIVIRSRDDYSQAATFAARYYAKKPISLLGLASYFTDRFIPYIQNEGIEVTTGAIERLMNSYAPKSPDHQIWKTAC